MGADSKPSAYIATRAQQGDPPPKRPTRCGSGAKARVSGRKRSAGSKAPASGQPRRPGAPSVRSIWPSPPGGEEEQSRFLDAAVDQLLLAVAQGSPEAMVNLAKLYLSGHFGEENRSAGVALLRQAIARDNLEAEVLLARLEYNGQLVAKAEVEPLSVCTGPQTQAIRKPSCSPCGKSSAPSNPSMISPGAGSRAPRKAVSPMPCCSSARSTRMGCTSLRMTTSRSAAPAPRV